MHPSRSATVAACLLIGLSAAAQAEPRVQTDWSGGPAPGAPVAQWTDGFESVQQISWRALPGQLALSSAPAAPTGDDVTSSAKLCRNVAAADLDGDGDLDLMTALPLTSFPGTGKVRWYENAGDGQTWTEHEIDGDFYGGSGLEAGDIDGDGDLDVAGVAFYGDPQENGRYVWFENLGGAQSWAKHPIAEYFYGAEDVNLVDLDADGDLDVYGSATLAYLGSLNDDVYWFENADGAGGAWVQHTVDDDYADAIDTGAADFDGDGDLDLACSSYGSSTIRWYENGGDGLGWTPHTISGFTALNNALAVGDIDDDGDPDVVGVGYNGTVAGWFENASGDGLVWTGHVVGTMAHGSGVGVADLDGDGALDVYSAGGDLDNALVTWYRNLGGGASWSLQLVDYTTGEGQGIVAGDTDGDGALELVYTDSGSMEGEFTGLRWRRVTRFLPSGQLDSQVLDAGAPSSWTAIDWTAALPPETALALQLRSSNDPLDLGPWSAAITSPGSLDGVLAPGTRYAQYRVLMETADGDVSPTLLDLTLVEGDVTDVPGGPLAATGLTLSPPWPNPAVGASRVRLALPAGGFATVGVYDAAGRRVATPLAASVGAGERVVELPALPPGVYFVRASAGGEVVARKIVAR
ncbi:T9SS type A sorting domain-containing protein [bacterium]|nr:T9SS type A sorting domain-containing protein [bacterium]